MSNTAKATPATVAAAAEEKVVVPEQKTGEPTLAEKINAVVADVAAAVKTKPGTALSVTVKLDENDNVEIQVDEAPEGGKAKKLVAGAKGLFQRNKKLVLATAGLVATSVVLKVIANRQAALEADEVVESSGEGIPLGNTGIVVDA